MVAHEADKAPTAASSPRDSPKELFMQRVASPQLLDGVLPEGVPNVAFSILLAEDDFEFRRLLASTLRADGYSVTECANCRELLDHVASDSLPTFDLIISDIRMPALDGMSILEVDGMSILEGIRQWKTSPPWILITAFGDAETHTAAERLGVVAFFDKPFDLDDLRARIRELSLSAAKDE